LKEYSKKKPWENIDAFYVVGLVVKIILYETGLVEQHPRNMAKGYKG
jgi:hypothetical protein